MRLLLVVLSTLVFFSAVAQQKKLSKKKLIEQADYYFFKENFPVALRLYDSILHNYPKNHYVQYHKYVAHHLTDGRGTDLSGLREFEKNEGHTDKFYNYWLGRIHFGRYEFDLAEEHFDAFLNLEVYRTKEIIKETEDRLELTRRAKIFYTDINDYEVEILDSPINSSFDDLSPAFFSDHSELLFVSSRNLGLDTTNLEPFQVYHTIKNGTKWSQPSPITSLGTFNLNNAKIEVVNEDGRLFMYNDLEEYHDLYFSQPDGNGWQEPVEFDSDLRNKEIASHFFISDDETLIIFSALTSNNDLDLFETRLDPASKTWSKPQALAGLVNTKFDEDGPFVSHDGKTLYFSSNSPESIGGYDIFKSEWNSSTLSWGYPINVGFPINTIDDEINYQLNPDNISGFLSSSRIHGQGAFDIYYFHKQGKVMASGRVYNEETRDRLRRVRVDFLPVENPDERFRTYTDSDGRYRLEIFTDEDYIVEFSKNNQLMYTDKMTSRHEELKKTFYKDFYITPTVQKEQKEDYTALYDRSKEKEFEELSRLGSKFRAGQKAMLKNIYFDTKSAHLTSDSKPVLDQLLEMMQESSMLKIEIAGHTDNLGSQSMNQFLSEHRAENVKDYLVKNGISENRIKTTGHGSKFPLASNDDEKDGRELNRRIEVIVIE